MCRLLPGLPGQSGSALSVGLSGVGHTRTVDAHAAPINRVVSARSRQHHRMQRGPYAVILPFAQASPACHSTAEVPLFVEVDDASCHAMPGASNSARWVERTPAGFVFDMKALRLFTGHQTDKACTAPLTFTVVAIPAAPTHPPPVSRHRIQFPYLASTHLDRHLYASRDAARTAPERVRAAPKQR